MPQTMATLRDSASLASRERGGKSLLCCRGLSCRRDPEATGRENPCRHESASFAVSLCSRIPHPIVASTIAAAKRSIGRNSWWRRAARNLRPEHHCFEALSLGISGERAFSFPLRSVQPLPGGFRQDSFPVAARRGFRFSVVADTAAENRAFAGSLLATEGGPTRCVPPVKENDQPRSLSPLWSVARTQTRLDAPLYRVPPGLAHRIGSGQSLRENLPAGVSVRADESRHRACTKARPGLRTPAFESGPGENPGTALARGQHQENRRGSRRFAALYRPLLARAQNISKIGITKSFLITRVGNGLLVAIIRSSFPRLRFPVFRSPERIERRAAVPKADARGRSPIGGIT